MLKQLLPLFRAGLGGRIGSGKQAFSFIHCHDFCRAVQHLIDHENCQGVFNMTAPGISSNSEFTRVLANVCNRPALFTVPAIALRLVYGNAAIVLTSGQKAFPESLLDSGFAFQFPELPSAIKDLIPKKGQATR